MKKHWICIIEVDEKKLPNGFDAPPRRATIEAIENKGIKVKNCWSGWGSSEEKVGKVKDAWFKVDNSNTLRSGG